VLARAAGNRVLLAARANVDGRSARGTASLAAVRVWPSSIRYAQLLRGNDCVSRQPQKSICPDAAPRRRRISVRPEDFRFRRYAERSEALTIFIVDASGSTALHRLGEAKGAVELLLADCYVRRDYVALVALRGREAELVLPPTRALTKAKRSLAGLPGGGGTPLASGIEKSLALALCARRRDQHPTLVVLTDGAANVARGGNTGRRVGEEDALVAGRQASAYGLPTLLIDTGPRPSQFAAQLADCMNGRYFALPMADAKALSDIVKRASANG
jgi:magnesium chelatase subunit D